MNAKTPIILLAVIVGALLVIIAYGYLSQPQPMSERFDNAASELGDGNIGNALDQMDNQTVGEQIGDNIEDAAQAVSPSM